MNQSLSELKSNAMKSEYASVGGKFFKPQEGSNVVRFLAMPEVVYKRYNEKIRKSEICYTDCGFQGTPRYVTYVLDKRDNKVRIYEMPSTVFEAIESLQGDEIWNFKEFPMPYEINISAKDAGTKEVVYIVTPRPHTPVSDDAMQQLAKAQSLEEYIREQKDNQKSVHVADGTWQMYQDQKEADAQAVREKFDAMPREAHPLDGAENLNPDDIPFD